MGEIAGDHGLVIETWIERCRALVGEPTEPPYLDGDFPELDNNLPFDLRNSEPVQLESFVRPLERQLGAAPFDLAVRFAALYPFKWAALSAPGEYFWNARRESVRTFKYLASLCLPERLTGLAELKFELHNMYLAANWAKADEILRRIGLLDLVQPQELHPLRGKFWFLSVFGRQIQSELGESDYICDWQYSLPDLSQAGEKRSRELELFARPEPLKHGSLAHWLLMAWCTNPRVPKPIPPPDAPTSIIEDPPDPHDTESTDDAEPGRLTLESVRRLVHEQYRDFQPIKAPSLTPGQHSRLSRAAVDLRQAITIDGEAAIPYRPLLARAMFALGDFKEAGATFERMIDDKVVLQDPLRLKESEDYRWEIFFSAARSHRLAGDVERAIDILQRLAADERNAAGTGWWIAKWYSEDGDYEKAAQYLRRELEQRFSPPESWQLSSIIALGAIASERDEASSFSKNLAEKAPNLYLVMCGLIQEHWPLFTRLSTESQSHWLYAAAQVHADCPLPEVRPAYLNSAVREYGWVLEHELKTGVFESFRKDVAADPRLREHLREDYNQDSKEPFLRFLQKKPEIGLGAMIKALEQCRHSSVKTEKNFCRWLDDRFPRIQTGVTAMGDVNRQRDRATHGNAGFDAASVRQVSSKCREALAALFGCGN